VLFRSIGIGIGALASNILMVNNYRDVETDIRAGKRTLVVRFGRRFARIQFGLSHIVGVTVLGAIGAGDWHPIILIGAIGLCSVIGWLQSRRLAQATTPQELIKLLGATGLYLAIYATVLSVGLIWG